MITRDPGLLGQSVTPRALQGILAEHERRVQELDALRDYYDGEHAILRRSKTVGASNNRLVVNHARYIVELTSAYLIGNPVGYAGGLEEALQPLLEAYRRSGVDSVDAELAKHAGIYGRAVELLYMDAAALPRAAVIDPRHAFVVYDDTVAHAPLLGIHRARHTDDQGRPDGETVWVYTGHSVQRFALREGGEKAPEFQEERPHYFGGVPVIEYWNNEDERGDYEPVRTLIDAYNLLMSDRVNDKEQLVDALLMLSGVTLGDTDDEFNRAVRRLRDQRILEMPAVGAAAAYLTKQLNESEIQVLADALVRDIHKIAMVPALTDESFAGNASGVAMRYKLLGLEQLTKTKERWFREGLRCRMRLFANVLAALGHPALDADVVQMTFSRGLPVNGLEQAQMVGMLRDLVPQEMLLKQLPFIDDAGEAMELMRRQRGM